MLVPLAIAGFAPSPGMRDLSSENFGFVIAFLIPGFIALWGLRLPVPEVATWLAATPGTSPTIGGFLYGTLGSVGAGLVVSAVRWALVDTFHHLTGCAEPAWDFRKFSASMAAFESHVRDHYRFYQFYANTLVALLFAYACELIAIGDLPGHNGWKEIGLLVVASILFVASRDTLRKYYSRTAALIPGDKS